MRSPTEFAKKRNSARLQVIFNAYNTMGVVQGGAMPPWIFTHSLKPPKFQKISIFSS